MIWHFADIFETVASLVPERIALIDADAKLSWAEYEDRAARLAGALVDAGIRPNSKVAIYGENSSAFLEAQFAIFKARGVPVNVNYRYVEDELHYLFDNADVEAVFFDARFAFRLEAVRERLPKLKFFVRIEDGSEEILLGAYEYESLIAENEPLQRLEYSEDDIYMVYTGGTTGMPKGVMYRHGDISGGLCASLLGLDLPAKPDALISRVSALSILGASPRSLPACPLMHATGMWIGAFSAHFLGGTVITQRTEGFDPHAVWKLVESERVSSIAIVGDVFAKPLLAALQEAKMADRPYDLSCLKQIGSSGVMFSADVKRALLDFADIEIRDSMGSTEGSMGASIVSRVSPPGPTARFVGNITTKVFNDSDEELTPGSEEIGMIANGGFVPVGYYKDPEKSAKTFREVKGKRYSFPGDFAKVAEDGSLILLGRGSACINTGGEKVFPEEVEEVLKAHQSVWDALVIGVPDDRFGEQVTAVVAACEGKTIDPLELAEFVRSRLSRYKTPRTIIVTGAVKRAANGKADYGWARSTVLKALRANAT
jgi:fatty-acyl-CoA synthase